MCARSWLHPGVTFGFVCVAAVVTASEVVAAPTQYEAQIEAALAEDSTAEFLEVPLEDVLAYFSDLHKIPIHMDRLALEAIGLDGQEPITISAAGIPFESMLALIFEPRGATWTVRHSTMIITSSEAARKAVSTRIYRLDKLVKQARSTDYRSSAMNDPFYAGSGDKYGSMTSIDLLDVSRLAEAITNTIEPQSWDDEGPGRASVLSVGGRMLLVIRQDYRTHRMIDHFLEEIAEDSLKPDEARDEGPFKGSAPTAMGGPSRPQPMENPFGDPPAVQPKRPTDDPFGSPAPSKPRRPADDPFGAPAPATANDPFADPGSNKDKPREAWQKGNPFGAVKDPFAIPEKE